MTDPFAAPAAIPSTFPSVQSFNGRLILIRPTRLEQVPNRQDPRKLDDRITANVTVVDGAGPIPLFKERTHTGQFLDGPEFPGTYFGQSRIINQLRDALENRGMVLARVSLYKPQQPAGQGNPWGLDEPTEADKQMARDFLARRTVSAAVPPAPQQQYVPPQGPVPPQVMAQTYAQAVPAPAPGYVPQPVAAQAPQQYAAPVQQPQQYAAPVPQQAEAPGPNPFAQPQQAPAPVPNAPQPTGYVPGANPFA